MKKRIYKFYCLFDVVVLLYGPPFVQTVYLSLIFTQACCNITVLILDLLDSYLCLEAVATPQRVVAVASTYKPTWETRIASYDFPMFPGSPNYTNMNILLTHVLNFNLLTTGVEGSNVLICLEDCATYIYVPDNTGAYWRANAQIISATEWVPEYTFGYAHKKLTYAQIMDVIVDYCRATSGASLTRSEIMSSEMFQLKLDAVMQLHRDLMLSQELLYIVHKSPVPLPMKTIAHLPFNPHLWVLHALENMVAEHPYKLFFGVLFGSALIILSSMV